MHELNRIVLGLSALHRDIPLAYPGGSKGFIGNNWEQTYRGVYQSLDSRGDRRRMSSHDPK